MAGVFIKVVAALRENMEYNYPFAELVGLLTVNSIKEILLEKDPSLKQDILKISHDIDTIIKEKDLQLSSKLIREIIYLAQMDLHIWTCKERMAEYPDKLHDYHWKAHQINGLRNKIKNSISEYLGDSKTHTNDKDDDLEWDISL